MAANLTNSLANVLDVVARCVRLKVDVPGGAGLAGSEQDSALKHEVRAIRGARLPR